jgi:hypothetical protein
VAKSAGAHCLASQLRWLGRPFSFSDYLSYLSPLIISPDFPLSFS